MNSPLAAIGFAAVLAFSTCSQDAASAPKAAATKASAPAGTVPPKRAPDGVLADAELHPAHAELLDLAFAAVSAMPLVPHRKNRARMQAMLVSACLEFGLPVRAKRWNANIDGWERGQGNAELALYLVRHGVRTDVEALLANALRIADESGKDDSAQRWRRDRIRAKVAGVHLLLGDTAAARALQVDLSASELVNMAEAEAEQLAPEQFDAELARLDALLPNQDVDQATAALRMCTTLFRRLAGDGERRRILVERIENSFPKLPLQMRLDFLIDLGDAAVATGDKVTALALFDRAAALVAGKDWVQEDQVALRAKVALHRARAGDQQGARQTLTSVLDWYHSHRTQIVDIFRGDALRPIAEGYAASGDIAAAEKTYTLLVEEGVLNPNSRPRAEDLAKTCASMVSCGFVPDAILLARLRAIAKALGEPW